MNKERFHNQLALNLGYQRVINGQRIKICIDDKQYADDIYKYRLLFKADMLYTASEGLRQNDMDCIENNGYENVKSIVDAVHEAYVEANSSRL